MLIYLAVVVLLLAAVDLWEIDQLKLTIIWAVSVAAAMLFRINEISKDTHFFKNAIRDNIKIIVLIEFVVNVYSLSLWIELILVPLLAMLTGMLVIAESDQKYSQVETVVNWLLGVIGIGLLGYAIHQISANFRSFATNDNLREFMLPPIMSALYLPFVYVIALFMTYEVLFIRLGFFVKEQRLLRQVKMRTLKSMNVNLFRLKRWSQEITKYDLSSDASIDKALNDFNAKR